MTEGGPLTFPGDVTAPENQRRGLPCPERLEQLIPATHSAAEDEPRGARSSPGDMRLHSQGGWPPGRGARKGVVCWVALEKQGATGCRGREAQRKSPKPGHCDRVVSCVSFWGSQTRSISFPGEQVRTKSQAPLPTCQFRNSAF